jgi:hypothetical protein
MLPVGSWRSLLVVATRIGAVGTAPVREKLTRRVARMQRMMSWGPRESEKMDSLASGVLRQVQVPALSGRVRQSAGAACGGAGTAAA